MMRSAAIPRVLVLTWTVCLAAALPASANEDIIRYASAQRSLARPAARYEGLLPDSLDLRPDAAGWLRFMEFQQAQPTHLQDRICRGSEPDRRRLLGHLRRNLGQVGWHLSAYHVVHGCEDQFVCEWAFEVLESDELPKVKEIFWPLGLRCDPARMAPLVERPDAPANTIVDYYAVHPLPPSGYSPALARYVGQRTEFADSIGPAGTRDGLCTIHHLVRLDSLVALFAQRDNDDVANTLLDLYHEVRHPAVAKILALGLRKQTGRRARKVFERECRAELERVYPEGPCSTWPIPEDAHTYRPPRPLGCESEAELAALGARGRAKPRWHRLIPAPSERPSPPSIPPALQVALEACGMSGGAIRILPDSTSSALAEHAPLGRRMARLVAPVLDEAIFEERWPAIAPLYEGVEDAPYDIDNSWRGVARERSAPTLLFSGWEGLEGDLRHSVEAFVAGFRAALRLPHPLDVYLAGERFRFEVPTGELDAETIAGVVNALLAARDSDRRVLPIASGSEVWAVAGDVKALQCLSGSFKEAAGTAGSGPGGVQNPSQF